MDLVNKLGCAPKLGSQQLHVDMQAHVCMGNSVSDSFAVTQGVEQECVLAPTLFTLYLMAVLTLSPLALCKGVYSRTRFDGKLLNLSSLTEIQN